MFTRENIKIEGHKGTWHVIQDYYYRGMFYHLLEHEIYGEDAAMLWVDHNYKIIADEVFNGIDDLLYELEEDEYDCNI